MLKLTNNNKLDSLIGITVNVARFLLSFTFIFSGFVKALDPKGMAYKLDAYGISFGLSSYVDDNKLLIAAIFLGSVEFLIGVYLFFGIRRKFTTILLLLIMVLFTPFTLYLAIKNPVHDCGCFGDAIILSNWATFGKNLVLLVFAILVFWKRKRMYFLVPQKVHWAYSLYSMLFIVFFCLLSIHYLPLIDMRPYKIGVDISEAMEIQPGQKGPSILDFSIAGPNDEDLTQKVLTDTVPTFVLVSPHFENASLSITDELNTIHDYCMDHGYKMIGLTASGSDAIQRWRCNTGAVYPIYFTDDTTLKTIVRSNPGLVLLQKGLILNKWSCNDLPNLDVANAPTISQLSSDNAAQASVKVLLKIILAYVIPLLFITLALNLRKRTQKLSLKHRNSN